MQFLPVPFSKYLQSIPAQDLPRERLLDAAQDLAKAKLATEKAKAFFDLDYGEKLDDALKGALKKTLVYYRALKV